MWRTWFRLNAIYFSFYVRHLDGLAKLQLVLSHIFSAAFWFVFFWSVECVVHWAERLCTLKVINDDDIYPMIRTFLLRSTPWQVNLSNQILIKKRTNSASDDQWMTPLSNIIFITLLLLFTSKIVLIILCVFFFVVETKQSETHLIVKIYLNESFFVASVWYWSHLMQQKDERRKRKELLYSNIRSTWTLGMYTATER